MGFVSDAETRQAMVELEMKSVKMVMKYCRVYLICLQRFVIMVEHQALIEILSWFTLDTVENIRPQRMKE